MLIRKDTNIRRPNYQIHHPIIHHLFQNQYQIVYTPKHLFTASLIFATIFILLTVVTFAFAYQVQSLQLTYAEGMTCTESSLISDRCSLTFVLHQPIKAPVYLLYVVKNIYINHRKFLEGYNLNQLKGKTISLKQAQSSCKPFIFNGNISQKKSWDNIELDPSQIASPCGKKAQGYFNDSFKIYKNSSQVQIDRYNIYNGIAINYRRQPGSERTQWIDPESNDFKLYMLDGSLMTRKKLWGVLHKDLQPGEYQIVISNNYRMPDQNLIKGILLQNSTIMGGQQYFYCISFGLSAVFFIVLAIITKISFPHYQQIFQHYMRYE